MRWGRHLAGAVPGAAALRGFKAFLGWRFDRAVGEEEGLPVGCAGVQRDGIWMVGVHIGACGGTGEKGAKRA